MEKTYLQWKAGVIKFLRSEYPNADKDSMDMQIESSTSEHEYFKAVYKFCLKGGIVRRAVLDCLCKAHRDTIFHDCPNFLDRYAVKYMDHYISPEVMEARYKTAPMYEVKVSQDAAGGLSVGVLIPPAVDKKIRAAIGRGVRHGVVKHERKVRGIVGSYPECYGWRVE